MSWQSPMGRAMREDRNKSGIEIDDEFADQVKDRLAYYTIGFLSTETGESLGSGTLVQIGGRRGIVTAAHVARALPERSVGILRFVNRQFLQSLRLDPINWRPTLFPATTGRICPDLAFLELPHPDASTLSATNSFTPLPASDAPNLPALYAIAGTINEATVRTVEPRWQRLGFTGLVAMISEMRSANYRSLDYRSCTASYGPEVTPPSSYAGVSGGGMWSVYLDLASRRVATASLCGVAFYQSQTAANGSRRIVCHGPRSIHRLVDEVQRRVHDEVD